MYVTQLIGIIGTALVVFGTLQGISGATSIGLAIVLVAIVARFFSDKKKADAEKVVALKTTEIAQQLDNLETQGGSDAEEQALALIRGASPEIRNALLAESVHQCNIARARKLLEIGINPNCFQYSLLSFGCLGLKAPNDDARLELVDLLISKGAVVDDTALHVSVSSKDGRVLARLLDAGGDPSMALNSLAGEINGAPPHLLEMYLNRVNLLVERGADPHWRSPNSSFSRSAFDQAKKNPQFASLLGSRPT